MFETFLHRFLEPLKSVLLVKGCQLSLPEFGSFFFSNFMCKKIKKTWKKHPFLYTCKGLNIDPFKFSAPPLKLSLASWQESQIWTSLYSNPPWYKMVIKGGTSRFIHLIILTQFGILPPFIYLSTAVQILLLFRGRKLWKCQILCRYH